MSGLQRIVRESGLVDVLRPADQVRQQAAVGRVIDPAGGLHPRALAPYLPPLVMTWPQGSTQRHRAAAAGTAVLLAAYAVTPPSTGNAIVTLTLVSPSQGLTTIATCQITQASSFGEAQLDYPIPAGAWLHAALTTPAGASAVSTSLTVRIS